MAYQRWTQEELREISENSLLSKMVESLGIDVDNWLDFAVDTLPETLRLTGSRSDVEWTKGELRKMGGVPISWMPEESAWQMPFARGKAPEGYAKRMMSILHDSGRITRQEAASMLPVELLGITDETVVLDMCAAPGSKTTQVAEKLAPSGFVIANEPVASRANMLISNRARLALPNVLINQQDGRHIGRIPPPGYDAILADVPCSGSATTRKNVQVWQKWRPLDLLDKSDGMVMGKMLMENSSRLYNTQERSKKGKREKLDWFFDEFRSMKSLKEESSPQSSALPSAWTSMHSGSALARPRPSPRQARHRPRIARRRGS